MTQINQLYKCEICGNIVVVTHSGDGALVCCNQPMNLLVEKSTEEGQEKHLPIIEKNDNKLTVKIGSVPHPMETEHYIEWVEVLSGKKIYRKVFSPGDQPEAQFNLKTNEAIEIRAFCNVHGLWKTTMVN